VPQAIDWKAWKTTALIRHDSLARERNGRSDGAQARGATGSQPSHPLERAGWERMMRRLRVSVRLLGVVMLAVIARMAVSGPTPTSVLSASVIGTMLIVALRLIRYGHRIEP
jgi:hypothetical protein